MVKNNLRGGVQVAKWSKQLGLSRLSTCVGHRSMYMYMYVTMITVRVRHIDCSDKHVQHAFLICCLPYCFVGICY